MVDGYCLWFKVRGLDLGLKIRFRLEVSLGLELGIRFRFRVRG